MPQSYIWTYMSIRVGFVVVFDHSRRWVLPNHFPPNAFLLFLTLPPTCFFLCLECAKYPPTTWAFALTISQFLELSFLIVPSLSASAQNHCVTSLTTHFILFFSSFIETVLTYNNVSLKCTVWWFDTCIYCKIITAIRLVNTPHLHSPHIITIFGRCVWWWFLRSTLLTTFKLLIQYY